MVLELHELGYQVYFKNFRCQRQVPRWTKKMGYSSSPSSSTPKNGRWLIISQTVLLGQIFLQLMLMGHFGPHKSCILNIELFCISKEKKKKEKKKTLLVIISRIPHIHEMPRLKFMSVTSLYLIIDSLIIDGISFSIFLIYKIN